MKSSMKTLLIALSLLIAGVGTVTAQAGNGDVLMARLDRELQVTDQLIERAQEFVRASDNPLATVNLDQATKLQTQARDIQVELQQHFEVQLLNVANKTTMKARELAKAAMVASRQTEQYEGGVQRDLEQAEQYLERAREAIAGTDNRNLQALMNSAENNLARAWEFYRQEQYRPAYKMARQVENAAQKILAAADVGNRRQENYERRLEHVNRVMEQTREQLADCGNSDSARKLMEQAEETLRRAEEFDRNNQEAAALRQLRTARELAVRAQEECQGTGSLQQRYERMLRETERLREMLQNQAGPDAEAARKLIQQAAEQLEMARNHIANQQNEKAQASLKAAQLTIRQATRYTQDQTD